MPVTFPSSNFADTDFNPGPHILLETAEGFDVVDTHAPDAWGAEPVVAYGPHGFPFEEHPSRSPAPQVPRPRPPGLGVGLLVIGLTLAVLGVCGLASLVVSEVAR